MFQQDSAHDAEDGGFIGKNPLHIRSPLDLSLETFDRIGGEVLRPVVFREDGVPLFRASADVTAFRDDRAPLLRASQGASVSPPIKWTVVDFAVAKPTCRYVILDGFS